MKRIFCLALYLALAPVLAREPLRMPLDGSTLPAATTFWYGVYMEGSKVGWIRITLGLTPDGQLIEEWENQASLQAMGEAIDVRSEERSEFDPSPPFGILRARSDRATGSQRQSLTLERTPTGFEATSHSPGGEHRMQHPAPDFTFEDSWTTLDWFRHKPGVGDALTVRSLNVEAARVDIDTYHVDEADSGFVQGVLTQWYSGRMESSAAGETGRYTAVANGSFGQFSFANAFEARLEDEYTARQISRGKDLFVMGEVRIDSALGDPAKAQHLVLEMTGEGADRIPQGPRQSVEKLHDGRHLLKIGAKNGIATPATASEINVSLASTLEFPASDERILSLAKRGIGDAQSGAEKVRRLVAFVSDYVEDRLSPAGAFNALDVVASRRGDCTEHSVLFTALARAAGIPARIVSGLMYMGDSTRAFGGHAWSEVVIDGHWVPVDATWNQTEVDATHIMIGTGDEGEVAHLWVIGRLQLKLVDIERGP